MSDTTDNQGDEYDLEGAIQEVLSAESLVSNVTASGEASQHDVNNYDLPDPRSYPNDKHAYRGFVASSLLQNHPSSSASIDVSRVHHCIIS